MKGKDFGGKDVKISISPLYPLWSYNVVVSIIFNRFSILFSDTAGVV